MLLLFVAPVVSKSMMHNGNMPAAMTSASGMMGHHDMSAMAGEMSGMHHAAEDHYDHHAASDLSSADNDMACGYCDLLVHVPFLLWVFVSALLLLIFSAFVPLRVREEKPWLKPRSPGHYPRAPPCGSFTFL